MSDCTERDRKTMINWLDDLEDTGDFHERQIIAKIASDHFSIGQKDEANPMTELLFLGGVPLDCDISTLSKSRQFKTISEITPSEAVRTSFAQRPTVIVLHARDLTLVPDIKAASPGTQFIIIYDKFILMESLFSERIGCVSYLSVSDDHRILAACLRQARIRAVSNFAEQSLSPFSDLLQ